MTNRTDDDTIDESAPLVPEQIRWALEYIITTYDETNLKTRREQLRDVLKQWIMENCEQDENGNYIFEFDRPVQLDDKEVRGLMAQRRTSEYLNEDRAYEIAEKHGVLDQAVQTVEIEELDMDKMYALNQQGLIPDEDIDYILEVKEMFALTKMEG